MRKIAAAANTFPVTSTVASSRKKARVGFVLASFQRNSMFKNADEASATVEPMCSRIKNQRTCHTLRYPHMDAFREVIPLGGIVWALASVLVAPVLLQLASRPIFT
jgi:hypothetical protein